MKFAQFIDGLSPYFEIRFKRREEGEDWKPKPFIWVQVLNFGENIIYSRQLFPDCKELVEDDWSDLYKHVWNLLGQSVNAHRKEETK